MTGTFVMGIAALHPSCEFCARGNDARQLAQPHADHHLPTMSTNPTGFAVPDFVSKPENFERDRDTVAMNFWRKLKRVAAKIPFAEDLLAAYYCAFDRQTPRHVQAALVGALAYFILPFDFVPDFLPVLGFTDDAAVLATALRLVATHIREEHREAARAALKRGV
jgi:uncharacterized membrane protein YkvA (DUF1232 family)